MALKTLRRVPWWMWILAALFVLYFGLQTYSFILGPARLGFDWPAIDGVVAKIDEEISEVKEALAGGDAADVRAEIGDLLFAVVNLCRFAGAHAEEVLNGTVRRFSDRFREMERRIGATGRHLEDCSLEELAVVWGAVKQEM